MSSMVMSSLGFLLAFNCFGYLEIPMCMHAQSCVTLCAHTDCSQPGFSTHGISKARLLEWVSISSSRGSSQSRDRICISWISCIAKWILYHCSTWEAWEMLVRTAKQRKACSSLLQAQLAACATVTAPDSWWPCSVSGLFTERVLKYMVVNISNGQEIPLAPPGWLCNQVPPMVRSPLKTVLRYSAKEYHRIFCNFVKHSNANSLVSVLGSLHGCSISALKIMHAPYISYCYIIFKSSLLSTNQHHYSKVLVQLMFICNVLCPNHCVVLQIRSWLRIIHKSPSE